MLPGVYLYRQKLNETEYTGLQSTFILFFMLKKQLKLQNDNKYIRVQI